MTLDEMFNNRKAWLDEYGTASYLGCIRHAVETKNHLEKKIQLVINGESRIFNDWAKHSTITKEEFIEGLKWLCDDEFTSIGKLRRELALSHTGLVKLVRHYYTNWDFAGFYTEDGHLWEGEQFPQYPKDEKEARFFDTIPMMVIHKICISAVDQI